MADAENTGAPVTGKVVALADEISSFFELSNDMLATASTIDGTWRRVNPAVERTLGWSAADLLGDSVLKVVHPDDRERSASAAQAVSAGQTLVEFEHRVCCKDGSYRWIAWQTVPDLGKGLMYCIGRDVTETRAARDKLRESEARQAFQLRLSDALRPLVDSAAIQGEACRLLGECLHADWVVYGQIDQANDIVDIERGYSRDGEPPITGKQPLSAFGWTLPLYKAGITVVEHNTQTSDRVPDAERPALAAILMTALISVPLLRAGEWIGALAVSVGRPRVWTELEVRLVEDTAERIWAAIGRARAEAAQHRSEARFRQFAEASSDLLWIGDAKTLEIEYLSPAFEVLYGSSADRALGDIRHWASFVIPEDRPAALERLGEVSRGVPAMHEFRILRPSDGAFRWVRATAFPLLGPDGEVERVAGISQDITEVKQAASHQAVLLAELQHRVRNILAMTRSIARRTGDSAHDVSDFAELLDGRLGSLARTQSMLTRHANHGVDLATLIREELSAQAEHAAQFDLSGPQLQLAPKAAEVMTLAVHELATNALKYGALAHREGKITAGWGIVYESDMPWLRFEWRESGSPEPMKVPTRKGFGMDLVQRRVPYELNGRGSVTIEPDGLRCVLEFPLRRGDSILETDAVMLSTTIEGGSLDMSGEADLHGSQVLVVEDDFYLAGDAERALQQAGATVLGPAGTEQDALEIIHSAPVSCAILDVNLGHGPTFGAADALMEKDVPFLFVTGYDDEVIPARFETVKRLRKPIELRQIVRAVAQICG